MKKYLLSLFILTTMLGLAAAGPLLAQTADFGTGFLTGVGLGTQDIRLTVVSLIRVALGLFGIILMVIIVAAGFRWMTAGGNDDAIATAKKMISAAVIGLIIVVVAYALTTWVFNSIIEATIN